MRPSGFSRVTFEGRRAQGVAVGGAKAIGSYATATMKPLSNWTTETLFNYVHGNHLVYNTCWEDPRLDREVLELGSDDEVVMITSAGCNALDYALDGPKRIHAVDMNFRQNALLELKIAGIRNLEHDEFFAVFGEGGTPEFKAWYRQRLRRDVSLAARDYWDERTHFFGRKRPSDSFYHRGTTGLFARAMIRYFRMAGVLDDLRSLFSAHSLEEQREIYHGKVRDKFWRPSIRRALRTDLVLSLLGVPAAQKDHLEQTCGQDIATFMEDCVEAVCTRLPASDNYFWRLYLFGRYTRDCCPEYLRESSFNRLKSGLVDRIETFTDSLTGFLLKHPRPVSRFVLLDHMDWLSHRHPEALAAEWQAIMDRASVGCRILWRSGGFSADFVDPVPVRRQGRSARVGELLTYDRARAAECHRRDRVHTYGSFHIAKLAA